MPRSAGSESSLSRQRFGERGCGPPPPGRTGSLRAIAVARGGKNGADDLFYVVLHEPLGHQRRLVPRAPWLPGGIAGLAFLKPVSKNWACIFSHGRKSLPKRFVVVSNVS